MNLAIFAPQALRNSLLVISFLWAIDKRTNSSQGLIKQWFQCPPRVFIEAGSLSVTGKLLCRQVFYVIQELLAAEVAGGQDWEHPAQNTQKATVTPFVLQVPGGN